MSPDRYYRLVVRPAADDCIANRNSPPKAIIAAILVHHFPEHIFAGRHAEMKLAAAELKAYRARYSDSAWFAVLDQVANAAKHGRRRSDYDLSKLWTATPSIAGRMMVGRTFIGDSEGGVVAALSNSEPAAYYKLHKVIAGVLKHYEEDFEELGHPPVREET